MTITESVTIETAQDLYDLRDNREDFHEGAMSILTYPTAPPVAYFSFDPPKMLSGVRVTVGDTVARDAAGNFFLNPAAAA